MMDFLKWWAKHECPSFVASMIGVGIVTTIHVWVRIVGGGGA